VSATVFVRRTSGSGKTESKGHGEGHRGWFGDTDKVLQPVVAVKPRRRIYHWPDRATGRGCGNPKSAGMGLTFTGNPPFFAGSARDHGRPHGETPWAGDTFRRSLLGRPRRNNASPTKSDSRKKPRGVEGHATDRRRSRIRLFRRVENPNATYLSAKRPRKSALWVGPSACATVRKWPAGIKPGRGFFLLSEQSGHRNALPAHLIFLDVTTRFM